MGTVGSIRAWRAPPPRESLGVIRSADTSVFVVDDGPSKQHVVSSMTAELDAEPWRDPHDYVLIDERGRLTNRFTTTTWSLEDDLGASVYAVVGGSLRHLSVTVVYSDPPRVRRTEEVVVEGLQAVAAGDHTTLTFLSSALERQRQAAAEAAALRARAAEERLAAIPGAQKDYAIGSDFQRAQDLLCKRVRAYGTRIDSALLTVLTRFGDLACRIRDSGGCEASAATVLVAALDAYVIACRRAAFDRTLERPNDDVTLGKSRGSFGALPPDIEARLCELARLLDGLQRDLLQEAEGQEWSDANLNAAAYREAAAHVSLSHACLKRGAVEKDK